LASELKNPVFGLKKFARRLLLGSATPVVLVIPMVEFAGCRMENPRVKGTMQTVIVASAGLRKRLRCGTKSALLSAIWKERTA